MSHSIYTLAPLKACAFDNNHKVDKVGLEPQLGLDEETFRPVQIPRNIPVLLSTAYFLAYHKSRKRANQVD